MEDPQANNPPPPLEDEEENLRREEEEIERIILQQEQEEQAAQTGNNDGGDNNNNNENVALNDPLLQPQQVNDNNMNFINNNDNNNFNNIPPIHMEPPPPPQARQYTAGMKGWSYTQTSLGAAVALLVYALRTRQQWYLALVYIRSSKVRTRLMCLVQDGRHLNSATTLFLFSCLSDLLFSPFVSCALSFFFLHVSQFILFLQINRRPTLFWPTLW